MGFYWQTYFYPDYENEHTRILLASIDPIIDAIDDKQEYICKKQLLQYFHSVIKDSDITEKSRLVEFMSTTYGDSGKTIELPIK
jgi:hypothetical protein